MVAVPLTTVTGGYNTVPTLNCTVPEAVAGIMVAVKVAEVFSQEEDAALLTVIEVAMDCALVTIVKSKRSSVQTIENPLPG